MIEKISVINFEMHRHLGLKKHTECRPFFLLFSTEKDFPGFGIFHFGKSESLAFAYSGAVTSKMFVI